MSCPRIQAATQRDSRQIGCLRRADERITGGELPLCAAYVRPQPDHRIGIGHHDGIRQPRECGAFSILLVESDRPLANEHRNAMLHGVDRCLQLRNSCQRRVQLGASAFGIKLVASTCLEALQRDVERVLLILGVAARHLQAVLAPRRSK